MKKILVLNFLIMTLFNFAHPVTPMMMQQKGSPDYLFGLFFFMMSAGTFFFSPRWGSKIDKIGTKKILTITPIAYAFGQFMFAYFTSPVLMLLGRFISGAFAAGWIVGVTAYINLKSTPERKVQNFGYQMVSTSLGGVVGQLASGKIGSYGVYYSFAVQITMLFVVSLITLIIIDNLYPKAKPSSQKTSFSKGWKDLRQHGYLKLMLSMVCLATIANMSRGLPSYFGTDMAGFTTSQVGDINAYTNGLVFIANLFIIHWLERHFTFTKSYLMQGIVAVTGALGLLVAVNLLGSNGIAIYLFIISLSFVSLGSSMYKPYVQKEVVSSGKFEQGEMLGVINSFNAIGMLLSSATMSIFYTINPILPFIALLLFAIAALGLHISYTIDERAA